MIALSLFDGKSSAFTAMELAGIPVTQFLSSEIDKYAIQVSNAIHPNQTRLGDITQWKTWDIDWHEVDIVFAGFPCQAWSVAGKELGDKDERGMLFWTMLDVMKHVNGMRRIMGKTPAHFLIENVKMKKQFEEYITHHTTEALGNVHKILINSALVSAQNRNRYYWTSFPVEQPEDRGIMLVDVIETEGHGFIKNHGEWNERSEKSMCIDANYHKGVDNRGQRTMIKCGRMVGRKINPETGKRDDYNPNLKAEQRIEPREDDKSGCLKTVQKDNHLVIRDKSRTVRVGGNGSPPESKQCWDNVLDSKIHYRKLTPRECFRLQTTPEPLIDKILSCGVSNTQLYKIAGNGWNDETIAHILRYLP